ncbi:MAG: phosphoribosyltransferase [Desulfovibrionales bacterium]
MANVFQDRKDAGRQLAEKLARLDVDEGIVLALPRGGVPVAYEVAKALHLPLDVFVVRKIGVPGREEFAMGAIATGGIRVLNSDVVQMLQIPESEIERVAAQEQKELQRREREYRGEKPPPKISGRTVLVVDDGLATGATMRAAVKALQKENPARLIVGVPTAAPETCDQFREMADEIVCLSTPSPFYAVGTWYEDFTQTTDEEVRDLLQEIELLQADEHEFSKASS